ncbi:putative inorganic phosphate cotransporter isoform X3 [Homalodisca vitripennis]|nr:putative inorganic phosphate cotransporter isoform X3 [Homalodisca vitripennis]
MTDTKGSDPDIMVLDWDFAQKGIILSSFYWGYMVTQIPAGHLSRKFGPKYLLLSAMLVCSATTLLSPSIAVNCHWVIFCLSRVIQGLSQGFFFPSVNTHIAKWAPPGEKTRIFSFVFGGTQFGTVLILPIAGYLAASPWGWPSIFYCTGLCGVLWSVVWLFVGADSPDSHPSINDREREYINSSLVETSSESNTMPTPWRQILTSGPMWALLIASLCHEWGYSMLLIEVPSYLSHVFGFDIKQNGLISSLPYIMKFLLMIVFSWIADYVIKRRLLSLSVSRKMWSVIGDWGEAAALWGLACVSTNVLAAVILITITGALNAGVYPGFFANSLDLAPNFAGLLMGIVNGLSTLSPILAPIVTGYIVTDETDREQWIIVFHISAALFFTGSLIFVVFGSTDTQPWNNPTTDVVEIKNLSITDTNVKDAKVNVIRS